MMERYHCANVAISSRPHIMIIISSYNANDRKEEGKENKGEENVEGK